MLSFSVVISTVSDKDTCSYNHYLLGIITAWPDEDEDKDNPKNIGSVVIPEQLKSYDQKNKKFLALLNSIGHKMYENASEEVKKKVTEGRR